ncbi:MAG TPA: hypothetical protein VMA76_02690, partial [Solirubrobacteraceae bacterium]|nr:hypothetical protein [Solirubrobacteraceae bacterium]
HRSLDLVLVLGYRLLGLLAEVRELVLQSHLPLLSVDANPSAEAYALRLPAEGGRVSVPIAGSSRSG